MGVRAVSAGPLSGFRAGGTLLAISTGLEVVGSARIINFGTSRAFKLEAGAEMKPIPIAAALASNNTTAIAVFTLGLSCWGAAVANLI